MGTFGIRQKKARGVGSGSRDEGRVGTGANLVRVGQAIPLAKRFEISAQCRRLVQCEQQYGKVRSILCDSFAIAMQDSLNDHGAE